MAGRYTLTIEDYDDERSTFGVAIPDVDDANFTTVDGQLDALEAAIVGITTGNKSGSSRQWLQESFNPAASAEPWAQRETKWLVRYRDNVTGDMYRCEIPTADLDLLPTSTDPNVRKGLDLAAGAGLAFKTAFEDVVLSPDSNAVTVEQVIHVGRNR